MINLEQIESDIKTAMKSKDSLRLAVLRLIKTALKNKEIDKKSSLTEQEVITVLSSLVKQRLDSIAQYRNAGQEDRALAEEGELLLLREYLPQPLSPQELVKIIQEAAGIVGATGPKDMGLVMKEIKEKTTGRIDGQIVATEVKNFLQSLSS